MNQQEQIQEWEEEIRIAHERFEKAEKAKDTNDMLWQTERMLFARKKIKLLEGKTG